MKPLTKDLARTGALVALATGSVLIPIRHALRRSAAPKSETLAVQTFAVPLEGDVQTIGVAINDNNEVVGTAFDGDKQVRAFVVRNRKAALLPLPNGARMSVAAGINADGIVVGMVGDDTKVRGILWHGDKVGLLASGQKNTLGTALSKSGVAAGVALASKSEGAFFSVFPHTLPGSFSSVDGFLMNDTQIWSLASGEANGMLWQRPGEGKSLGEFLPQAGNADRTLVGVILGKSGPIPAAFQGGKLGKLPMPEQAKVALPLAVNESETIVGAGVREEKWKPLGWSRGKTGFLPVPGGRQGVALGINDAKTVVGAIEAESGEAHAAVWLGGKVIDLNKMVDPDSGWTLVQARGINNKGFVVGTAIKGEKLSAFVVGPVK